MVLKCKVYEDEIQELTEISGKYTAAVKSNEKREQELKEK